MKIKFVFEATALDVRNWVVDFGSLKSLKGWLEDLLDHKTLVAEDDPSIDLFHEMHSHQIIELRIVPATGMEKLAEFIYEYTEIWLIDNGYSPRCRLKSVKVDEHEGNSATFYKELVIDND